MGQNPSLRSLLHRNRFSLAEKSQFQPPYRSAPYTEVPILQARKQAGGGFRDVFKETSFDLVALFALVWVANQHMSIYNRLRLDIKHEQVQIKAKEKEEPPSELKRRPERAA